MVSDSNISFSIKDVKSSINIESIPGLNKKEKKKKRKRKNT